MANNFERGDGTFFAGGDNSAPIVDVKATNGATIRLPRSPWLRVTSAAALTSLTLKMPAVEPGDVVNIHFVNGIANFALRTFLNAAIVGAPTTILPKAVVVLKFFGKGGWVVLNSTTVVSSVGVSVAGLGTGLDGSTSGALSNTGSYDTTDPDNPVSTFTGTPGSTLSGELYFTQQTGITAFAGGGGTNATPITAQFAQVATVATAGDSVKLPPAVLGDIRYVVNNGAHLMEIYASGSDLFYATSNENNHIDFPQGASAMFVCMDAGVWQQFWSFGPFSTTDSVTAQPGGGTSGPLITTAFTRVTVVATAGDSIILPDAVAGAAYTLLNSGANPLQLFATGHGSTDTVGGIAGTTGISIPAGARVTLMCLTNGAYHVAFAMGNANGTAFGVKNAVTAHASGGRGSAVAITTAVTQISVCATPADSVVLPAALPGDMRLIINDGAAAAQVFANGSDTIDGVAGATGVVLTQAKRAFYFCAVAGAWFSVMGVKSA